VLAWGSLSGLMALALQRFSARHPTLAPPAA
jgi:hypothetical protein